jgi:potassium-transporting ATPase potassium-binding subunit
MTILGWLQIIIYCLLILAITVPVGAYMFRVFERQWTPLDLALRPVEWAIYAVCGVDETKEQRWTQYAVSVLLFSLVGLLFTYLMQ